MERKVHPTRRIVSRQRNSQHYSQHGLGRGKSPSAEVAAELDLRSVRTAAFEPATPDAKRTEHGRRPRGVNPMRLVREPTYDAE